VHGATPPTPAGCTCSPRRRGAGSRLLSLKGSDTVAAQDLFGSSVAISGTTVAAGAWGTGGVSQAYVFTKTATGWKQAAELYA
jgi:hypothetical protein